jgi:hypothetical protein
MPISSLAMSTDSLIVASVLSLHVPSRDRAPLVVLFGACDGAASMIAASIGGAPAGSSVCAPIALMAWGILIILNLRSIGACCKSPLWAYAFPPLLALDNLLLPGESPVVSGLVSSALAAIGMVLGAMVRVQKAPIVGPRWVGVPMLVAGLLLVM